MHPPPNPVASIERHTANAIARLSPANQALVSRLVRRRANQGIRPNSNQAFVFALRHVDQALSGKALDTLTAYDIEDAIALMRTKLSPSTVFIATRNLRRSLQLMQDPGVKLAPGILEALKVRRPADSPQDRIITDPEFHALLDSAASHRSGRTTTTPDESVAILWVLWDSGFRAHELLALRIESVTFEDDGTVTLAIPADVPLLKGGPRTIAVVECAMALKAWLSMHPAAGNPKAPLFPGFYDKTGLRPLSYEALLDHVRLLGRRSGVANPPTKDDVTPHDFRHTCATRKARAGWVESQLRLFFGWKRDSKMPAKYVNMALSDLRERVKRDYGITPTAFPLVRPMSDGEQLAGLIQRLAQGQQATRTAFPVHMPTASDAVAAST